MSEYIVDYEQIPLKWRDGYGLSDVDLTEEIVRCRDCAEYEPYHTYAGMKLDYGMCMKHERETNDDRFCWWGGRRTDE